jgi:hypothetical protein
MSSNLAYRIRTLRLPPRVLVFLFLTSTSGAWAQAGTFNGFVAADQIDGSVGVRDSFLVDFDDDEDLDLVEVYAAPEAVRTFFNDGRGGLKLAAELVLPGAAFTVAMGDANGDDIPDLAWAESVGSGSAPVRVYYGESGGGFRIGQELRRTNDVASLAFAHVDSDSALDLVVAQRRGTVHVYTAGRGGLLRLTARLHQKEKYTRDVAVADFNGDGNTDVITATRSGSLFLFEQGAGGRFSDGVRLRTPAQDVQQIHAVDLNGDPFPDLILATSEFLECPDYVYHGEGGSSFTLVQTLCNESNADGTSDLDLADLDGDGLLDLVALRDGDLYYLGKADGTFGPPRWPSFTPPVWWALNLVLGDIDGDGVGDALVRDSQCCNTATHVYLGTVVP